MAEKNEYNYLTSCPVCNGQNLEDYLSTKDFTFSGESFTIQKCVDCGFRFTNPIPLEENIGSYYGAENYMSHASQNRRGFMPFVYKQVRRINLNNKLRLVKKYANGMKLLDIGAGNGFFLNACKNVGFEVGGLEPDAKARLVAKEDFGLQLLEPSVMPDLPDSSYDVITMWHVLEHVYHLKRDVAQYKRMLKKDGALIVAVPNIASYDARHYEEFWDGLDLPLHLYHFTPDDIRKLFDQFQMEMVEMVPMRFDAYWVSMNSEKFKGGSLAKAFLVGLKSNWRAKNGEYSSQIYVLKHKNA